jgi:hypothetical protein
MPRAIVSPARGGVNAAPPPDGAIEDADVSSRNRERADSHRIGEGGARERLDQDQFKEKLVKYVPAEVLSGFIPLSALAGRGHSWLVWLLLAAGAVATWGRWVLANRSLPMDRRAPPWGYVLAVGAFVVWAVGASSSVDSLLEVDAEVAGVILGVGAWMIPLLDELLTGWRRPVPPTG